MQNFLHVPSLCLGIPFNCTALGIHLCKTSQNTLQFQNKDWITGEICWSDVNVHKGYIKLIRWRLYTL